jgi:hypothetical protein
MVFILNRDWKENNCFFQEVITQKKLGKVKPQDVCQHPRHQQAGRPAGRHLPHQQSNENVFHRVKGL